jgi:hypothetical protein
MFCFQIQLRCVGFDPVLRPGVQILPQPAADAVVASFLVRFGTERLPELRLQRFAFHQAFGECQTSRDGCIGLKGRKKVSNSA